ncbi:AAA family ATPase [Sedimentitalea sp. HM32M-2]|uniref:AAA family ATPase n=1 Tax=Sedimentitalea sp. HM32M-2 TaxID=3351566 RepID=UPI003641EA65
MIGSQYLPPALLQWSRIPFDGATTPCIETFDGAVLIVDISGSTGLTVRLSRLGVTGAEQINRVLTRFFSDLVMAIEKHGGMVLGYEGDSVIVGWRATEDQRRTAPLLACCACATEVRRNFSPRQVEGQTLDVRIAIGAGSIDLIHLGHPDRQLFLLPAGDALEEATRLTNEAGPGEVLISPSAAARVQAQFRTEARDDRVARLIDGRGGGTGFAETQYAIKARIDPSALHAYLLSPVRARLDSALLDWMGELRRVTMLFAQFELRGSERDLAAVNATAVRVEEIVRRQGGVVLRLALRRGLLVIDSAFGLPGQADRSEDWRAIAAAMRLQSLAHEDGFGASAGITAGRVFCGPFGAAHCRDYTVIGAAVNLAARLRDVAAGRILADEAAQENSLRSIRFDGPWPVHVSGIRQQIQTYIPTGHAAPDPPPLSSHFVGRHAERSLLDTLLQQSRSGTRVAMIHGEGGIGKSTLVASFLAGSPDTRDHVARGVADALDRQTPYLAWRRILRNCLGLPPDGTLGETDTTGMLARLAPAIGDTDFAPLLNDIIDLNLPETRATASMASNVRAENLRQLTRQFLLYEMREKIRVLVIEDAHWLDDNSRALLTDIIRAAPPLLVLVTARNRQVLMAELTGLADKDRVLHDIPLAPLGEAAIVELARHHFGDDHLSEPLRQFIVQTSDGVPLFVEELCHLAAAMPSDRLPGWAQDSDGVELPKLLEAAILRRVDSLAPNTQRVLKIASVLGLRFNPDQLARLAPLVDSGIDVAAAIERILELRLFQRDKDHPTDLTFRHQIIRDLVYGGLLSEQKVETHAAVAQALEARSGADTIETLPLLLNHWRLADDAAKVATYLERVAALRLRQFDNASAISLLSELIERLSTSDLPRDRMRDARCHIMLGIAQRGLGQMAEAEAAFRIGLANLGLPLPLSPGAVALGLAKEVLRQCRHRLWPRRIAMDGTRPAGKDLLRPELAAQAHEMLIHIFYFSGQKKRLLHSALSAANFAADLGVATPSLAINTAGLGAICGVIPLRRQARYYLRRASALAEAVDDPTASSRVALFSGLYDTAIGQWNSARDAFLDGLAGADTISDHRLWCENAASFELICSPWALTPAFRDVHVWDALVDRLEETSSARHDMQALGCALLGRLRGNRCIGRQTATEETLERLEELMDASPRELELVHYVEAAGVLAITACEAGQPDAAAAWIDVAREDLADLDPGMKSRTLPALVAVFDACLSHVTHNSPETADDIIGLASTATQKLRVFARVYPIGQPYLYRCKGDLAALNGNLSAAARHWRISLTRATDLQMRIAAAAAAQRLQSVAGTHTTPITEEPALVGRLDTDGPAIQDIVQRFLSTADTLPWMTGPTEPHSTTPRRIY